MKTRPYRRFRADGDGTIPQPTTRRLSSCDHVIEYEILRFMLLLWIHNKCRGFSANLRHLLWIGESIVEVRVFLHSVYTPRKHQYLFYLDKWHFG
jgi:hypothetical protein